MRGPEGGPGIWDRLRGTPSLPSSPLSATVRPPVPRSDRTPHNPNSDIGEGRLSSSGPHSTLPRPPQLSHDMMLSNVALHVSTLTGAHAPLLRLTATALPVALLSAALAGASPQDESVAEGLPVSEPISEESPDGEEPERELPERGPTKVEGTLPLDWVDTLEWRSIGPANMGGRITDIAVNPADASEYWISTAASGPTTPWWGRGTHSHHPCASSSRTTWRSAPARWACPTRVR